MKKKLTTQEICDEARKRCNKHTHEERLRLLEKGMKIINEGYPKGGFLSGNSKDLGELR